MAEVVRYEDLISEIITERCKGATPSKKFLDIQTKTLRESWSALNGWIKACMTKRKGIHIPTLCRMTWEFMADPQSGNVRVRPVFVLTESFIRGLRLPNTRKPELPQTSAPCLDINYSKIAIKFSKNLTKVRARHHTHPRRRAPKPSENVLCMYVRTHARTSNERMEKKGGEASRK